MGLFEAGFPLSLGLQGSKGSPIPALLSPDPPATHPRLMEVTSAHLPSPWLNQIAGLLAFAISSLRFV